MVRPITLTKPPVQPQKVNASANAAQIARLEAQAAQLREQIRLANRMGERDWAAQARQELAHVNAELGSLQPPPVAATAAPGVNVVNASNGTSGNGTTVTPALYVRPDLAAPVLTPVKLDGGKPEDNAAEATTARNIVNDVTGGKSIDQIASARGMTREQVIATLRSGGMTVSTTNPTSDNGDVQATKITDASGRTVSQYYDYQHDSYYTSVGQPNGTATTTPVRDGLGRKETSSYNPDTGAITTRYEDDLGTGTVTERTSLPNGTSVETVTPGSGPALPVTTVSGPDGHRTVLAASQDPGGATTQGIKDDLAVGKNIEQIAQERGLTSEQVIAELQAAGYQVTTREPTSDNGDVQSVEVVDPHTGDKTVYYHDYQHDERTVVTTSDGKETTVSEDGNGRTRNSVRNIETGETTTTIVDPKAGTETKIVTDKDGRVTTTTTEEINGGEPVEYEVKPGDNLTLIAQQYGVSLDDLRRTNPELFNSHRDPDIIHPGEKVTIENGTRTTVEVTFNGYTLTTRPDGSMTLHNNTTGADLKIEAGSTQEALARTLLAVNPNSSDATEAKEGEVVKTFVEGLLAGETLPSLIDAAEEAGQNKQDLIERYGLGTVATPKLDGENRVVDPFGDPPQGNAPSGGKWTPMKIDGVWTWVDPEVAQAIIAENVALSRITETRALAGQRQEQFNVHMLDPAYKDAVDGAQTIINEALAPHGLQWTAQKPKGTLADARERLTKANSLLQNAQDARSEYETAGRVLADAITQQSEVAPLIDPNADVVSAQGQPGPNRQTQYAQGLADHAAVDELFSEVGLHLSEGDKLTIDFLVGQAELDGIPTDSKEYQDLKALQTTAGNQLELAEAYQNYFDAHADATQVGAQQTDLEQRLLAEYNSEHQFLFEQGKKHQRVSGDYLGLFQSQKLEVRDGQLWVVNQFEEGTTEQQLTYSLSETNVRDEYRDRQLNKDWQQLLGGANSSGPVCTANGLEAVKAGEAQAAKTLNDVLDKQLGNSITDLNSKLTTLQTNFNNALTEHGPGTVDAPAGTLPNGVQPVEINVGGQTIKVAPEVAQKYNQIGIDALTEGGKAVWIDLDTKDDDASGRWVDPELAVAKLKLDATRLQITQAEDLRRAVQGFSDYHELRLSDPSLLADRNSTVDKTYLDEHEQQTLDGIYQPKFQQLLDSGYDNEFRQPGTDLEETVARTLSLDRSTEEGREALENVTDEIRDIGGDNPYVRRVPIFYVNDEAGTQQVTLFAVRDGDGNTRYVDVTGKKFDDLGDFQDNNNQFGENGKLVVPKGLEMKAGDDGKIALEVVKARNVSVWDKVVDPLVGIGTGIATILSFTPAAPVAAPLAYTGAAYLGTRAVINQVNHLEHGGEWDDTESLMNVATVATTVLPMASSGLRTIGMAGKEMTALQAFRGSIGATRSGSPLALETRTYMQSTAGLNKVAWATDVGSVIVGAPLLATSAYDLAVNGDQMNGLQLANALTGLGTGITGTGLGIHGLRTLRPGTGTQASSNGPGANPPPGSGGPYQQPPSGKGPRQSPPALEPGPSGRPMNVYEIGADGVYRPTGEQVFHDPSHPVIPGEVIKTDDASGNGSTMLPGRDPHGSTPPGAQHPADGDPIVVPNKPAGKDGSVHLVWDPATRSFTGMPERDTSGYVYTSGKDPKTPSAYLDGLTVEQLVARYEQEKSYYSSREMAERYGPDGVQIPRTPLRETLPDFRVGVTFRVRLNTGEAFGIGSPTVAAVGFGVGTKTDFGMIGWSIVDSVSQRSLTPFKDALGTQGVVSYRAREYRNITALQAGVWPVSNQTAFPVRSSDLSAAASKAIFSDATGYNAKPLDAAIVGMTPDGEGTVIEMTYTPSLNGKEVTLAPGQHDFFGVPAENSSGHVTLQGVLPFDRVMTETKVGIRLPIVANHVAAVDQMPRIGFEKRPELAVKDTLQPGDIVSTQAYDQIQSAFGSTTLKIQFAVKDPAKASELVAAIGQGDGIRSIRDLVKSGQIDPSNTVSLVDEPTLSGLRLSAVPGKAPTADVVLLTGQKVRVVNPEAMLVDVIFNDRNGLSGVLGFNPDRMTTSTTYKVKSKVQSWLPARFQPEGSPQSRYMPSAGNIYKNLYRSDGTPATRYTLSLSSPPLPAGAVAYSAEVRIQYKSKAAKVAPSIAKNETATLTFNRADGQDEALTVPAWLAHDVDMSRDGASTGVPKGGKASLDQFLGELHKTARPDQLAAIEQFKTDFGPSIVDGGFMRQNVADGVLTFLSSQVGSRRSGPIQIRDENGQSVTATRYGPLPRSAENVYVPPADGSPAHGDEPELMNKSHILYRDPETGGAYVLPWVRGGSQDHVPGSQGRPEGEAEPPQAMPARKAIEAAPPTTYSLQQVRNMRQPEKWKAGETYTRELNGSLGEAHFPVEANSDGSHPVFGEGGRYVDSPVFKSQDVIEAIEVKTYHRWTTINGVAQMREVPLTPKLQEQINKDVALRNENPGYQPRWVFLDAPPSAELQRALDDAGIVGNIFGHNKPATATPQSQPTSSQVVAGRTMRLQGKNGEVIVAAMLGAEPRSPEQVYVPPSDGPRAPADAPEVQDKTHILVYDPKTGEAVVLPWIRGASDDHVPGSLRRPDESDQPASAADGASNAGRLSRGNIGPYIFRADDVRATPLDQVPDLVMGDFQPNQIPWLKREQVAELTQQQFRDMDQAGLLPYLTKSQLRGIPKAKIGQVNIAGLDVKQIPWLTEGHIRNMTDQQFRDLGKAGLTPHLTKPQLRAIKGDMVELVHVSKLEARQVPWFKPGQVAKFTSQQFKDLGKAGLLKNLTERQVQAIPETMIDSVDVAKLDPNQVPWLTEKQIPVLTRDQWGAFTIHHTEALTQPQIEAVTPKQFEEMSPGQFRKFTLEQFEWMSGDQTNALSVVQLTTYRATHKKAMTPDQATSVDLALSHARMRENAQALATFGGMSTTSYMLWSSLPPTWTATAGAVAFGVRGVVFGTQALFPNATASHKPFGRFLNALGGATFIAAAPGAATGMIQGKDLVVNSTFTLGNIVYGTKSMLQSFTGRPVIRNLAEYLAGPGYVLGCAVYTAHSWPAPIATVAGTMFTFGCAEFWASAIRTDRMNRRSVPRTDADIAAAEKSDKRWAAWDRWTLGITFGVGMLLFSLDALLAEPWEGAKTTPPPDPKKPDDDGSSQQPDDPSDVPDGPQIPGEDFPQLVVVADDGLNLRSRPGGDSTVTTVLQPGTFVEQTAKPSTDPSGETWIPIEGFGPDGEMHSGWVSGDYVEAHAEGSSNSEGRTNPTLEKDGYQWVEVKDGDSIRLIAKTHFADVAQTVVLNMDHILSPDMIFSGDRIYLPVTSVG
ncbi:MAG: LysM peptidoglycan-binding domain-containing protein [Mesorhizobium sp.]|uniref:LysM peptidoglycan-binding domain-containing protein n=1 Tax=Mesorhizobium sp. TaxID=1871066 RepID=UPI00121CD400|nr:LysM peptidoglycan-binding domain-containing protein [Mesorhizobium sp.]TIS57101.1 MAG: LysM peptidoglycan-binding domain-containing protein [Mesorhizobium sp.]